MSAAPTSQVTRGVALMILAIFLFTSMDATAKGLIERYPAPQVIWVRFAGQLPLVLLILRHRLGPVLRTPFPVLHFWLSASQFGATTCFFLSLPHVGLAHHPGVLGGTALDCFGADIGGCEGLNPVGARHITHHAFPAQRAAGGRGDWAVGAAPGTGTRPAGTGSWVH